jgi:hypothetical protein
LISEQIGIYIISTTKNLDDDNKIFDDSVTQRLISDTRNSAIEEREGVNYEDKDHYDVQIRDISLYSVKERNLSISTSRLPQVIILYHSAK